ncbi:MAG: FAD-dependent oxidoreductase [Candidatus Doudnabacteria bacterium]|nr:FAD-dependent oxidoreductase [Candidatus Doudnabacteria bacterium]
MYDVIIIGAGPAGMTAGIYAARKKLKTLILTKQIGGQMIWSSDVENYTGYSMISGAELTLKFQEHLEHLSPDLEVQEAIEVVGIEKNVTIFTVETKTSGPFYAKTVIIASGKEPRHLGIPGEDKFFGRGVAVCATCDAPLYKNKDVAVVGGGNSAMDALLALSKVARRVYSVNVNERLMGDEVLRNKVESASNVTFFNKATTVEIQGEKGVTGLQVQKASGEQEVLPVSGIFVEIGYIPSNGFDHLTEKNERGEVEVDGNLQSSVPGLFAAGDINDAWGEQIIIAAGEGAKAALAATKYVNQLK